MVLPIGDDNRDRTTTPIVNYLLIGLNIFVFIYWQHWGHNVQLTYSYSTVPGEILTGHDIVTHSQIQINPYTGQRMVEPGLGVTPIPVFLTLFTSMFLHGGLATLVKGQQVKVNSQLSTVEEKKIAPAEVAAWQKGNMSYDDEAFEDIVADLERLYNVKIRIENDAIRALKVSTSFRREIGIEQALQVLCKLTDTMLRQSDGWYIIQ